MYRTLLAIVVCFLPSVSIIGQDSKTETKVESPSESPADSLKNMQGNWYIDVIYNPSDPKHLLPKELHLDKEGINVQIEENRIVFDKQTVATFANQLDLKTAEKEIGMTNNRLFLLTLPNGQGLLCGYRINDGELRIAYPHTCFCHRGSGQVIYLKKK